MRRLRRFVLKCGQGADHLQCVREFDLNRVKMTGIDAPFYLNWSSLEPEIKAESYEDPKLETKRPKADSSAIRSEFLV